MIACIDEFNKIKKLMNTERTYYFQNHFYLKIDDFLNATIGIRSESEISKIVFLDLPEPSYKYSLGEEFIQIESAIDLYNVKAPATCIVTEINKKLLQDPSSFCSNEDTWLASIDIIDKYELEMLEDIEDGF